MLKSFSTIILQTSKRTYTHITHITSGGGPSTGRRALSGLIDQGHTYEQLDRVEGTANLQYQEIGRCILGFVLVMFQI